MRQPEIDSLQGRRGRAGRWMLAPLTCALCVACAKEPPLDVVIVTLDTTRADMLGSYGERGQTPYLDALAADSARYEHAITTAPYTGPSHGSLMTGLYPAQHGLRDFLVEALPERNLTLAEILGEHGYETAAFVSTYVLDPRYGLDQGFDHYSSPQPDPESGRTRRLVRPGHETYDEAIGWLRGRDAERPFFLWLHSYDAHGHLTPKGTIYAPPLERRRLLPPGVERGSDAAGQQRYYEQAGGLDAEVERVLAALREIGRYDRTLLIITSDHGELLGFHGRKLGRHSPMLVDETLRVPLIVRVPGQLAPGERARQVSLIDLFPTVLDALGLAIPSGVEGQSLLLAAPQPARPAYAETLYEHHPRQAEPGEELASLRHEGWKLIVRPGREELYDLRRDPDELRDLSESEPERLAALRSAMNELRQRWPADLQPARLDLAPEERAQHEQRLRSLGYIE